MPRLASGIYVPPADNPVVTGTIIETDWANNTVDDLATALTDSLDRNGRGGMLAPFKLEDGSESTPAFSFTNEPGTGLYRSATGELAFTVLGDQKMVLSATSLLIKQALNVMPSDPAQVPLSLQAATGQTANIIEIRDEGGTLQGTVAADGLPAAATDFATMGVLEAADTGLSDRIDANTADIASNTADIASIAGDIVIAAPPSAIMAFARGNAPSGWLECGGQAVSRTTYADLFTAIGVTYGNGDGSTTFNVPDLRGEFVRGWDDGSGNDPDAGTRTDRGDGVTGDSVGTKQGSEFEAHTHNIWTANGSTPVTPNNGVTSTGQAAASGSTGGNETRPRNVYMLYCIKV